MLRRAGQKTQREDSQERQYGLSIQKLRPRLTMGQHEGDRVVLQGDNLLRDIEEALDGKKLTLALDSLGGTCVGELAKSLKPGGAIVVYASG